MNRYFARYNIANKAWEVVDTINDKIVESFSCQENDELRFYAEHRALAHAIRFNQQAEESDRKEGQ